MDKFWEILQQIIKYFEISGKIAALITTILVIIRFVGYKYKKPILRIFKKNGFFGLLLMTRIIFGFRNNASTYTRMFCEYLIANNPKGELKRKDLKMYYKNFIQYYVKRNYDYIALKSTFEAIEILESEYLIRYFDFYSHPKNIKKYGVDPQKTLAFLLYIVIEKGYLVPAILLPGLQDHYNDDWSAITNRYLHNAQKVKNHNELFMFYTWLMWGPSYMPKYNVLDYKLLQYGMGDESKTFNVVLNNSNRSVSLWNLVSEFANNHSYGLDCQMTLRVNHKNSYIDKNIDMFGLEVLPFLEKIKHSKKPVILEHVDYTPSGSCSTDAKYFSAYIWALFIKVNDKNKGSKIKASDCVAFYGHANISEQTSYNFFKDTLAKNILFHFEQNYQNNKNKYYLNTTLNKDIYITVKNVISERIKVADEFGNWLKTNVVLEEIVSIKTLLNLFDEEFSITQKEINFQKITLESVKTKELLSRFYISVYLPNFPDINERESLDSLIYYLEKQESGLNGKNNYHIIIGTIGDEIVGGIIGDYFEEINSGVIEFVVVNEKYRMKNNGKKLVNEMIRIFNEDANRNGHKEINYVFIEAENQLIVPEELLFEAKLSTNFWKSQKFQVLDFDYIQPIIGQDKQPVEHLYLGALVVNAKLDENSIKNDVVKKFLINYAKYAMNILKPEEDDIILKNFKNLGENDITLKRIDQYLKDYSMQKNFKK
ncbi:MAG: GNAT family N-acetyltransferase [Acholeplasmataceae bacterium]|jgi:hypothetical protein